MPDAAHRSAGYFELIAELMEAFAQAQDVDGTLPTILERIREAMRAETASLFMLEGERGDPRARLVCRGCVGPSDVTGLSVPADAGIVGRTLQTNSSQMVCDVRQDPDFVPPPSLGEAFEVRSILCAPLSVKDERLGVVEIINQTDGDGCFDEADRDALEALATVAALAISHARLAESMAEQARLQRDLELAASVQRRLLPAAQPENAPIHGLSRPARGVSGDFFDILPLAGGRTAFTLADVSGKGFNAALVMVKAATLFRSLGKHIESPGRLLGRIERELTETMTHGMFVTMVVGVHDPQRHEVCFANAGHIPPLYRDARGCYREFPAEDPPLGILGGAHDSRYHEVHLPLAGGALYLYTDGIEEGRLEDGSVPGADGLRAYIDDHAQEPPAQRLESIAAPFLDAAVLHDDLTLLVVEDWDARHRAQSVRRRRPPSLLVRQTLAAQPAELKIVRRLVEAASLRAGATAQWAQDLVMAVDEACQNVIRHGYRGRGDGRIDLTIRRLRGRLVVELVDFAPPVAQDEVRGRKLDELRPGGLGTHFMRALTDRVRFGKPPPGAGNRLVLTKTLPPGHRAEGGRT